MTDKVRTALRRRREALRQFGVLEAGTLSPAPKNLEIDNKWVFERWNKDGASVFISSGCSRYSEKNSNARNEFVIHDVGDTSLKILNFVCFFEMTFRSILPADLLRVGEDLSWLGGVCSHVYVSVPFFFPGTVNHIKVDTHIVYLLWLMPVSAPEASYIDAYGAEKFEIALNDSGYGFFDARSDLSYLK